MHTMTYHVYILVTYSMQNQLRQHGEPVKEVCQNDQVINSYLTFYFILQTFLRGSERLVSFHTQVSSMSLTQFGHKCLLCQYNY